MQRKTRHEHSSGNLRELCGSWDGGKREIRGTDFGSTVCLQGERRSVTCGVEIKSGDIRSRSYKLIWKTCIPHSEGSARSRTKRNKNMIAGSIAPHERRSGEAGDLRLRSRLNRWRACCQIQLCEACGARAAGATLAAQADENCLRARGGNACGTGVGEAGNAADGHSRAGSVHGIDEIDTLRAEISNDQLAAIRRQSQVAQTRVWRRAAGRSELQGKGVRLQVESIDVINVGEIDSLAPLIVEDKPEKSWFRIGLNTLQILERFRGGCGPGGARDDHVRFARRPGGRLNRDALQRKWIAGVESERWRDVGDALNFCNRCVCRPNLHSDFCGIAAESVAIDLHRITTTGRACVREDLQDLRAIAEGVGREHQPAVVEKGSYIDGSFGNAGRRVRLDLCRPWYR